MPSITQKIKNALTAGGPKEVFRRLTHSAWVRLTTLHLQDPEWQGRIVERMLGRNHVSVPVDHRAVTVSETRVKA
ncbi:MAG: hypothetical protein ABJA67_05305 [Chthonomonadales bacterium]